MQSVSTEDTHTIAAATIHTITSIHSGGSATHVSPPASQAPVPSAATSISSTTPHAIVCATHLAQAVYKLASPARCRYGVNCDMGRRALNAYARMRWGSRWCYTDGAYDPCLKHRRQQEAARVEELGLGHIVLTRRVGAVVQVRCAVVEANGACVVDGVKHTVCAGQVCGYTAALAAAPCEDEDSIHVDGISATRRGNTWRVG